MLDRILDLRQKMGSQYTLNTEWIRANHPIFAYDVDNEITYASINGMREILTKLSRKHPQEMASILPSGLPEREAIEKWISNVIQVNEKFSEIAGNFQNPTISGKFETKTLQEIYTKYTPNVDWPTLLKEYKADITGDTTVLVKCLKCFEDIFNYINQNSDLIRSYLEMGIIIYKYSYAFGTEFEGLTWNLNNEPIETYCIMRAATHFGKAADRLFVDFFLEKKTRDDIMDLILIIKEQFRQMIVSEDWIDERTKKRALKKLEIMKQYSGYFDEFMDTEGIINENQLVT
uniref:Peptidase M13 N-terminal domain-containing protein n=1 Tax=Meloidogyne floridensis TaxID=298350 RepID=A0A915NVM5_9BILA